MVGIGYDENKGKRRPCRAPHPPTHSTPFTSPPAPCDVAGECACGIHWPLSVSTGWPSRFGCKQAEAIPEILLRELPEWDRPAAPLTKFNSVISPEIESIQAVRLAGTDEAPFGDLATRLKPGQQFALDLKAVVHARVDSKKCDEV